MQKQIAPTGQLVPVNDRLFYEAPTGDRVQVEDDRAAVLAQLLPLAYAGKLANAEARALQQQHDEVLQSASSQYHQMAMTVVAGQQKTIDGLTAVLQTVASNSGAVVERETIYVGHEDFAGKIVFVLSLVFGLMVVSFTVCMVARVVDGSTATRPISTQYVDRY